MELNEVRISCPSGGRGEEIELVPLGDIHNGTKNCDIKKWKRTVKYIDKKPNCKWLGMGDYWELIKPGDKRFDSRTVAERHLLRLHELAHSQKEEFLEIMEPILTPDKCIGLHKGNHEETIILEYGEDLVGQLCREFKLKDLGYQALTRLVFHRKGKRNDTRAFVVHSQHGHGGGRKVGSKVNLLRDLPANIEADVHLMGHVHDRVIDDGIQLGWGTEDKLLVKEKVFGITGTFYRTYMKGNTNYGEKRNYPPTPMGCIKVTFRPWADEDRLHIEKLRV